MKTLILSFAPIATLLISLAVLKLKAWQATAISLAVALAAAATSFGDSLPFAAWPKTIVSGLRFALCPICFVVFAALFTYSVTVASGALDTIRRGLSNVSDDQRVLALLIAWGFANFMEGMAGFGTAVAIPAAILVGIGFNPVKAVLMCLVINTTPTAYGSVGVPLTTLARESGVDLGTLSRTTAILQLLITAMGPFLIMLIHGGFKAFKGMWKTILLADAAFLVPWFLSAIFIGCELPDILGGIGVMTAIGLTAKRRSSIAEIKEQLRAWAPFAFVVIILIIAALLPQCIKAYTTPGAFVLIAGIIGGMVQKLSAKRLFKLLWETLINYRAAFMTICLILALARVMVESGMVSALAQMLVTATGRAYPFAAAGVGALGGFVTGSGTNSCVLFGRLQADAARALDLSPTLLAAANVMGAGIGKMICPQSIAIGAVAAGLASGSESILFRKALPWFTGVILAASLLTGIIAAIKFL